MKRTAGIEPPIAATGIRGRAAAKPLPRPASRYRYRQPLAIRAAMRAAVGFLLSASLWLATACSSATKLEFGKESGKPVSVAHLKSLCRGTTTLLTQELKIEGIVTANDIRGEFPKTLVMEDATGGIEIAIDRTALADLFPLGSGITVYCSGLALGDYGGKIQLGARPTGDYSVDRIAGTDLDRYIRITTLNAGRRRPLTKSFSDLGPDDDATYVRFEGVRFLEAGEPWCTEDSLTGALQPTLRTLEDASGNKFPVRILPSCHYAAESVPQGTGSVNGIADCFNGALSLRIVNYEIDFIISEAPPRAYPSAAEYSVPSPKR